MEIQGLRLAGFSRALHGNWMPAHFLSGLGVSLGILVIDSLPVNGWLEGDRAPCGLTLLQCGGAAPSGAGAEHGAIPRVMHSRKSPTTVIPSWLCLKWTQSTITAGDLGHPGHHQMVATAVRYQSPPRPCPLTLGSVLSKSLGLVSSTRTVSVSLSCRYVFWGWGLISSGAVD